MGYMETYKAWCENEYFDEDTRAELKSIAGDEKEIEDRFYKDLEFGTGGLRGVIGNGTNRMNVYIVRKATQGLANFIIKEGTQDKGVAISHDNRRMSREFAQEAALCLAANGIKVYIFPSLRPTPELSFAVRELHCTAGIMVTASHNPPEYNGYKVYWDDGCQITAPKDTQIINEVKAVTDFNDVKTIDEEEARVRGLYNIIGYDMDDAFIAALKKQSLNGDIIKQVADDIKIVYSPFNGTGNVPVRRILRELGFKNVYVVPEQEKPDPNFTTLEYPNPEDPKAFTYALRLAKEVDADIILATDPDADRLGVYSKDTKSGEYKSFTGNMSGMLIAEYLLSQRKEKGLLHENGAFVKTIVSTNLADLIAKEYNLKLIEVLTGFKYIGEQILGFETTGKGHYCFGFEESYGCLIGTHARDKDAVVATMALCEAVAYYKTKGMSLWDKMTEMYERYGYWLDGVQAITLKGKEGIEKIQNTIEKLRQQVPTEINGYKVLSARDYKLNTIKNMETGEVTETGLPKSNVLYYDLEGGAWVCVRPSGTEPKLKFYYGIKGTDAKDAEVKEKELGKYMINLVNSML